jgi:hypothetical protein
LPQASFPQAVRSRYLEPVVVGAPRVKAAMVGMVVPAVVVVVVVLGLLLALVEMAVRGLFIYESPAQILRLSNFKKRFKWKSRSP